MSEPELHEVISAGDPEAVRERLDAGADVRYVRPNGYAAMVDAMYGRDILRDANLLPLLNLLIDRGADIDATSDYGESALNVASRFGRFDAVKLLLAAGANPASLDWTPLHRAVALGTIDDVKRRLDAGDDPAARDAWDRTPLLLSLQAGETDKAELLLNADASLADRGRCGAPALSYPIQNDDSETLRWLLERGADLNAVDDFGNSLLIDAAGAGAVKCVKVLLDAGADPNRVKTPKFPAEMLETNSELADLLAEMDNAGDLPTESPMQVAATLEIARMLAAAGGNFAEINDKARDELTKLVRTESIECSPKEYRAAKHRVFGDANPQLINLPFQRAMVASGKSAYEARDQFGEKSRFGGKPVWCHSRFGMSFTELPDGRVIEIGGEHEDHYDPDFCIYNDVVVHHGDGRFDLYGYPEKVFPPTDYHTATLVDDHIFIIGGAGYASERRFDFTPVYRLNVNTLAIEPVETSGESPGWMAKHRAKLVGRSIRVSGGDVRVVADGKKAYGKNPHEYALDLGSMTWSKVS